MIGLKYRRDKITYTPYLIFSQNQLHPSLLQFSNPPSGNLFPIPGRKQFERRRFSIIPFHPFKSTHYHPPSGSQNRFPDPYSAPRIPTETSVFLPKKGETNLRTKPSSSPLPPVSISRHIPWTLCASLLCEAIVCDQYGWASPGACYGRRLRRPQLSLSTPSVETENPFKALTRDPLLCISFLPRFSFKEGGKGEFSLAISKNGSSFSRWKWKKKKGGMRMDGDDSIERGSKPFRYESWWWREIGRMMRLWLNFEFGRI